MALFINESYIYEDKIINKVKKIIDNMNISNNNQTKIEDINREKVNQVVDNNNYEIEFYYLNKDISINSLAAVLINDIIIGARINSKDYKKYLKDTRFIESIYNLKNDNFSATNILKNKCADDEVESIAGINHKYNYYYFPLQDRNAYYNNTYYCKEDKNIYFVNIDVVGAPYVITKISYNELMNISKQCNDDLEKLLKEFGGK